MKAMWKTRWLLLGAIGTMLMAGVFACAKKNDPAVTSAGGGAANGMGVITLKGAAR